MYNTYTFHSHFSFKARIFPASQLDFHRSDGYTLAYYPESEVVGYPVSVDSNVNVAGSQCIFNMGEKTKVKAELAKKKFEVLEKNPHNAAEEEKSLPCGNVLSENLKGKDTVRRSSIELFQGIDEDHPDLQSIQNIVANMTFQADID